MLSQLVILRRVVSFTMQSGLSFFMLSSLTAYSDHEPISSGAFLGVMSDSFWLIVAGACLVLLLLCLAFRFFASRWILSAGLLFAILLIGSTFPEINTSKQDALGLPYETKILGDRAYRIVYATSALLVALVLTAPRCRLALHGWFDQWLRGRGPRR